MLRRNPVAKKRHFVIYFLVLSAFFIDHATSADEQETTKAVFAPGVLDLPVLQGSFIPDDCTLPGIELQDKGLLGCILFELNTKGPEGLSWDWAYVHALTQRGWEFDSGAANVLWMKRSGKNQTCPERLTLFFWLRGDPDEVRKYGTDEETSMNWQKIPYGIILFLIEPHPACSGSTPGGVHSPRKAR